MEVFLPIAEVQINVVLFLFVSFIIGFLSGLFGVGGGFLMTPFLIFMGIPPAYAVANEANNILASSTSGSLTHWFKKTMDMKMGWMIIGGGLIGTAFGMITFGYFKGIDKIDLVITLAYMYVLAIIGSFMLRDGIMEIDRIKKKVTIKKKLHTHYWIHGLPFRTDLNLQTLRKCFGTNFIRNLSWFCCSNHGCWRSILNGSCYDIFNWNANKISTRNFFICNNFCNRICCCFPCFYI